ncbi:UROD/MetE-like protein [Vararia minispora EC-137]|uniref:UROD/MetE-like protein n=1 Tax=Vararia minispora EC-137 TaxID=1314806 RepID=A0ACB8QZA9_9AGAM|nr:UROD/MetE-like protein [Vararia minispora EC-137]
MPLLHLQPPFRAEHLGSLRRPAYLLEKRAQFDSGEISRDELRPAEEKAIQEIVQLQKELGLKAVTDGEFTRHMFFDGVFNNLDGFEHIPDVPLERFMDYVPDTAGFKELNFKKADSYMCKSKIKRTKSFYRAEFEYTKSLLPSEKHKDIKLTICAPEWFHLRHGPYAYPLDVYKTDEEYFADISRAYREEIAELYSLGCRNIQFDDPLLAYFCSEKMLAGMKEAGVDSERLLQLYINVYNDCLEGRPADMNVGVHLCRGNFKARSQHSGGRHFSEGGYDRIAVKLFNELNVDCYYLEYDTERAGTFEPLKHLPKHKTVVLGLVTSKFPQLEDPEEMKQRVHSAAEIISHGVESRTKAEAFHQICISPQCGFASHSLGNEVTDEDMANKLKLVVKVAGELWSDA